MLTSGDTDNRLLLIAQVRCERDAIVDEYARARQRGDRRDAAAALRSMARLTARLDELLSAALT